MPHAPNIYIYIYIKENFQAIFLGQTLLLQQLPQTRFHECWKCLSLEAIKLYGVWVLFGLFYMFFNFYRLDLHNAICVVQTKL